MRSQERCEGARLDAHFLRVLWHVFILLCHSRASQAFVPNCKYSTTLTWNQRLCSHSYQQDAYFRVNGEQKLSADFSFDADNSPRTFVDAIIAEEEEEEGDKDDDRSKPDKTDGPICRVVTRSDAKLPTSRGALPESLFQPPFLLEKLDSIYHAMAHEEARQVKYMESQIPAYHNAGEEKKLLTMLRGSLEDAGFELLSRRDIALCEALNAGYLLRLSILPDTSELDPSIAAEFFPEKFDENGQPKDSENILFDERVLVFWRGYSQEVSHGRLLLPKIDYLQASIVQRSAAWIRARLGAPERWFSMHIAAGVRRIRATLFSATLSLLGKADKKLGMDLQGKMIESAKVFNGTSRMESLLSSQSGRLFKFARYGGSKIRFVGSPNPTDALNPFIICEEQYCAPMNSRRDEYIENLNNDRPGSNVDKDMYECLNYGDLKCPYDEQASQRSNKPLPPMQLLKRVSLSSLVDLFSSGGRRALLKTLVSKSELVEPTYEEVVVVWRPLPKKGLSKPKFVAPKFLYDLADMFDFERLLPTPTKKRPQPKTKPGLEIRAFRNVPMANLPAVLPKTKLVFRPADALVFDLVTVTSLLLVIGSIRFDSPRLDILAIASVSLWMMRTVFRYSNKLARYDLLVKNFLTSKISHRNKGAFKYIANEAGYQRAVRAALVYNWLTHLFPRNEPIFFDREELLQTGQEETNEFLPDFRQIPIDIDAALNDLEDLHLVERESYNRVSVIPGTTSVLVSLKEAWIDLFDGRLSLKAIVGRRRRT